MKNLLSLNDISYSVTVKGSIFGKKSNKEILKNIDLDIFEGEFIAVSGPSGSGKSTLAKLIASIIEPTEGNIIYENILPEEIQILFQNNVELINPNRIVNDILDESIEIADKHNIESKLGKSEVMNLLGITTDVLTKRGFQLSGGQRQKVGFARILFQNPKLLILDEPFAAQDYEIVNSIIELIKKLNSEFGIAVICISHITKYFAGFQGRIISLAEGKMVLVK